MSPERATLRRLIDAKVRERVAAENAHLNLCAGCGMPHSDLTPGCSTCWDRHRNYMRRGGPYPPDPMLRARALVFSETLQMERSRRQSRENAGWRSAA